MKAASAHYFFANDWPARIWVVVFPLLGCGWVTFRSWPMLLIPTNWTDPLLFFGSLLLMATLGYFLGLLLGWPIIGSLYHDRSVKNGEPFRIGDSVQILRGSHRDRIVPVIEIIDVGAFAGGHRVRVDLGQAGAEGADFRSIEILRISTPSSHDDAEQADEPDL